MVATIPEPDGETIVAIGGYYLVPQTNRAEVAFVVDDRWQSHHIGSFLLQHLVTIARRNGIAGFNAEVLVENKAMLSVFQSSGLKLRSGVEDNVWRFELDFE